MSTRSNRTFFTILIRQDSKVLYRGTRRWIEIEGADVSDIQRKYLAAIYALNKLRSMRLWYDECILSIDSKLIMEQLMGKKSTSSVNIAELKSDLIGLMTSQGVTIGKERTEDEADNDE